MADLNKKVLADIIAEKKGLTKKVALEIIDLIIDESVNTLKSGGKVDITGFGKFVVKERKARVGINPTTKEKIEIPASKTPGFKASKTLKDSIK